MQFNLTEQNKNNGGGKARLFLAEMQRSVLLGHLYVPCTCWIKHLSPARGNGNERGLCLPRWNSPILHYARESLALMHFTLAPKKPALTSYLWPVVRAGIAAVKINLAPWIPAEQTNRPKQYDIYHISITLNASVSILHCPRHTPVTRRTRCSKMIMALHCSSPSGGLISSACA